MYSLQSFNLQVCTSVRAICVLDDKGSTFPEKRKFLHVELVRHSVVRFDTIRA